MESAHLWEGAIGAHRFHYKKGVFYENIQKK